MGTNIDDYLCRTWCMRWKTKLDTVAATCNFEKIHNGWLIHFSSLKYTITMFNTLHLNFRHKERAQFYMFIHLMNSTNRYYC